MTFEELNEKFFYVGLAPYNEKTVSIFKNKENFEYYISYTENVLNPLSEQEKENFLSGYLPDENIIPDVKILSEKDNNYSANFSFQSENSSAMDNYDGYYDEFYGSMPLSPKKISVDFDFKIDSELEGEENEEKIKIIKQLFFSGVEKCVNLMKEIGLPEEKIKECVSKFKNDFKIQIKKENYDNLTAACFVKSEKAIRFYPLSFRNTSISNVELTVCHELMHFFSYNLKLDFCGFRSFFGSIFSALDEAVTDYLAFKALDRKVENNGYHYETDLLFRLFPSEEIPNDFLCCYFNNNTTKMFQLLSSYSKIDGSNLHSILFAADHRLNLRSETVKVSSASERYKLAGCIIYSEKYIDFLFERNQFLSNDSKFKLLDLKKFNDFVDTFVQYHNFLLNFGDETIERNVNKSWLNDVLDGYNDYIDFRIEEILKENKSYSSLKSFLNHLIKEALISIESNEFYNRFLKIGCKYPNFILENLSKIEKDYPQFSGISEIKNELYSEILNNNSFFKLEIRHNAPS